MKRKSAIMQMYYMERGNFEKVPCSDEYFRLLEEFVKKDEEMRAQLSEFPHLLDLHKNATTALDFLNCEAEDNHYLEGFKFGLLMGLEAAEGADYEES